MKNFISKVEGVWEEVVPRPLIDPDAEPVAPPANIPASEEDAAMLQAKYLATKPEIQEGKTYKLELCIITVKDGEIIGGLLSFRINDKSKRINIK